MILWALILLTGLGGGFLTISWLIKKRVCTNEVLATICDIEHNKGSLLQGDDTGKKGRKRGARHFYPVYRFVMDGREYVVHHKEPSRTNQWEIGQQETLYVKPSNPDVYRVGNESSDLKYGICSLLLCAFFIAVLLV